MDRTQEVLSCEHVLMEAASTHEEILLPIFFTLTYEEVCVNSLTLRSNLLFSCQPYNPCYVSSGNLVLDQLIIHKLIFFFILITSLVDAVLIF